MQLNLVYFPTAYGTVDPVPPPVKLTDGDGSNLLHSQTNATADNRHAIPEAIDVAQLKLELAILRTRIETLQQQIDSMSIQK
jgi:hypothetical protein